MIKGSFGLWVYSFDENEFGIYDFYFLYFRIYFGRLSLKLLVNLKVDAN